MTITLQRARRERHNNNRALKQDRRGQFILSLQLLGLLGRSARRRREDTDAVEALEAADLARGFKPVHDGELDVHEHQMKAALPPLGHGVFAVHGGLPAHLEALHEGFEELEVDDVVFDN